MSVLCASNFKPDQATCKKTCYIQDLIPQCAKDYIFSLNPSSTKRPRPDVHYEKLGRGSFGIVYPVTNTNKESLVLKLVWLTPNLDEGPRWEQFLGTHYDGYYPMGCMTPHSFCLEVDHARQAGAAGVGPEVRFATQCLVHVENTIEATMGCMISVRLSQTLRTYLLMNKRSHITYVKLIQNLRTMFNLFIQCFPDVNMFDIHADNIMLDTAARPYVVDYDLLYTDKEPERPTATKFLKVLLQSMERKKFPLNEERFEQDPDGTALALFEALANKTATLSTASTKVPIVLS